MRPAPLLFDLAGRGSVVLTGKDRATFLHGLVTNDVKRLKPGEGCAAAFLTAKGKMFAECVILCEEDRLVLDTPPELAGTVEALLRKYLVFNDVTIANETDATHVYHLVSEANGVGREEEKEEVEVLEEDEEDLLRRLIGPGAPVPAGPHAHAPAAFTFSENLRPSLLVRENRTGIPGWDLRCPSSLSEEISSSLLSMGSRSASPAALESLRIAAGIPRWGAELTEAVLPDEAGLRERGFISDNKGCYVGQETVARIKTYGHVNRRLVRILVSGGVPAAGDDVFFEGEKAGVLTSVAPGVGEAARTVALAFVKREHAAEGTALAVAATQENLRRLPASVAPAAPALLA